MDDVIQAIWAIVLIVIAAIAGALFAIYLGVTDVKAFVGGLVFITPAITAISALARGKNDITLKKPEGEG